MDGQNYIALWNKCLDIFKDNVSEQAFKTWFEPIVPCKYDGQALTIQVPSDFFCEFLEDKYLDLIRKTLFHIFGNGTQLQYKIRVASSSTVTIPSSKATITPSSQAGKQQNPRVEKAAVQQTMMPEIDSYLKPDYNFESFIEGYSNKLARSVGMAIAKEPGKTTFNPLFIYGASGVGKTHLATAIGLRIKELYPEKRVLYVSAHLFQVQYTESVRKNTTNDFINFYQTIDTLIVDDIQEIEGMTKTQNAFFHIFNHLHQNGRQLIMTSDRSLVQLQGMTDRLITRFKWGMVAELERPTVELRKDILRAKMRRDGVNFTEEVVNYIAENVGDSVRDLEGIVASLVAHAMVYNCQVDMELAKKVILKVANVQNREITIDNILDVVCKHYNVDLDTLQGNSRKHEVVQARQVAMFLAKNNTTLSLAKIGTHIAGKDHATVLHSCKTVDTILSVDKTFRKEIDDLQAALKSVH